MYSRMLSITLKEVKAREKGTIKNPGAGGTGE